MIKLYKSRQIDYAKPVKVYRNLHLPNNWYTIKQKNLVVAHANKLSLVHCTFVVNQQGQKRVRATRHKNVHAYILGWVSRNGVMGTDEYRKTQLPAKISYNPYRDDYFVCNNLTNKPFYIEGAEAVIINEFGVSAAYTYKLKDMSYG